MLKMKLFQSMRKRISSRESLSRSSSQHSDKQQQQQQASPPEPAQQQEAAPGTAVAADKGETAPQGTASAARNNTRDRLLQADSLKAQEHETARYFSFTLLAVLLIHVSPPFACTASLLFFLCLGFRLRFLHPSSLVAYPRVPALRSSVSFALYQAGRAP